MTLFERVHMPSFAGATEWLNSEPLGPADLRGRVALVAPFAPGLGEVRERIERRSRAGWGCGAAQVK